MSELITAGEPLILFIADEKGPLSSVRHYTRYMAGAEVNVSVGVSRLGHSVSFLTQIGEDPFGVYVKNFLNKENIGTQYVFSTPKYPTGFMLKGLSDIGDPETFYFRKGSAASKLTRAYVDQVDFSGAKILHLGGILAGLSESSYEATLALIEKAREYGLTITFDPNLRPVIWDSEEQMIKRTNEIACLCDVVIPNAKEGRILTGENEKEKVAAFYLSKGVHQVIINLVEEGSYTKKRTADGSFSETAAPKYEVKNLIDRVGAGDGFVSGILSGMLENLDDQATLMRGNAICSIQMQSLGDNDGLPTREELDAFMKSAVLEAAK
ncbi:2-keto-3-deoxygluconate kinase [Weizmannia acidilactici]|uniref:2-keto-3-deoxygluconate kinase n=1 Tax=Weizmannia acidilactici TaxID=2607726 RepID=A0A5J4JHA1_9BACI|nr:sugar kinase [Weizmannia acidilactici]GER65913.1 2-keto-3-deoxygluconate kinase [Weizmannia acidilactici]GER69758.1 2-keto-3-deoxygluconate kinase [Weizmannia acidilactici]